MIQGAIYQAGGAEQPGVCMEYRNKSRGAARLEKIHMKSGIETPADCRSGRTVV